MNGRRFAAAICSFALGMMLWMVSGGVAWGYVLPPNIHSALNVVPFNPQIQQFIQGRIAQMTGEDLAAQSKAREELIGEALPPTTDGAKSSAQFLAGYASELNKVLRPLASHKDLRVRLNAAVIAARVAEYAGNSALLPTTLALLEDESEATRLWALKAAKSVLPATVGLGDDTAKLISLVVKIGKETRSGAVAHTVYEALTIDQGNLNNAQWSKLLSATVPALQEVLRARIVRYMEALPDGSLSELRATLFLTTEKIWRAQNTEQQLETMQLISDLASVAGQRFATASTEQRQDLIFMFRNLGGAIHVAGQHAKNPSLSAAGAPIRAIQVTASPEQVLAAVNQVYSTLVQVKGFERLSKPPELQASTEAATTNAK